ncbi:MAG: MOSC N-terminal beta barrel domain-containing protein [Anaerolinea sp.]|nr:MOSC N-terminal beta barrel domain-containing protein [Anaerolinea sp.]
MRVTALYTYPIKSCGALSHKRAALDARGLRDDRRWMVITGDGGFVTQREFHRMALIQPSYAYGGLRISAPDMPDLLLPLTPDAANVPTRRVVVWKDTVEAVDQGDEAAAWLSRFLGAKLRLVKMADAYTRLTSTSHTDQPAPVGFADGYPVLLAAESSLADLNDRLLTREKDALPMNRFRPNIVITGGGAWEEDEWTRITVGGIPFDVVKACARCAITTVDQATGEVPDVEEPLGTLATFRKIPRGVLFGQNIIHRAGGEICVGDPVTVEARK